eukprot:749318-Hanusia_phi.AAC.1
MSSSRESHSHLHHDAGEVDFAAFSLGRVVVFRDLDTVEGRLLSFHLKWRISPSMLASFPKDRLSPLSERQLAEAGFYYCPDAEHVDRCVCFSCNRALYSWDKNDNPMYEHCRCNSECPFVKAIADDNLNESFSSLDDALQREMQEKERAGRAKGTIKGSSFDVKNAEELPEDALIDHLLICIHGVAVKENVLNEYLQTMRKNSDQVAKKYLEERPMTMAVDVIDWHKIVPRVPKEILSQIMLGTVRALRDMACESTYDTLYYTSPLYKYKILDAVASLLNLKYKEYVERFPKFSGKVSLFCHSLGSLIAFDLLANQPEHEEKPEGQEDQEGQEQEELEEEDAWEWPKLDFKVDNLFAVGSPIAMFLTVRGDILSESWPKGATEFTLPGGAKFFNIFHPTDPIAYRFEPLLDEEYSKFPAAPMPTRSCSLREQPFLVIPSKHAGEVRDDEGAGAGGDRAEEEEEERRLERIDLVLSTGSGTGDSYYTQYVSSLTFASHW